MSRGSQAHGREKRVMRPSESRRRQERREPAPEPKTREYGKNAANRRKPRPQEPF